MDTGTSIIGTNIFAYCDNNPVMGVDYTGEEKEPLTSGELVGLTIQTIFYILNGLNYHVNPDSYITLLGADIHLVYISSFFAKAIMLITKATFSAIRYVAAKLLFGSVTILRDAVVKIAAILSSMGIAGAFIEGFVDGLFDISFGDIKDALNIFSDVKPGYYVYGTVYYLEEYFDGIYWVQIFHQYNFIFAPAGTSLSISFHNMESPVKVRG